MSVYREHELLPHLGLAEGAAPTSCTDCYTKRGRSYRKEHQIARVPINKVSSLAEMAERGKRKVEDTGAKQWSLHRDSELPKWQAKQNFLEAATSAALRAIRPHKQDRRKLSMR